MGKYLEQVGTVPVPITVGKFIAKERFTVNLKNTAEVKISRVGQSFDEWFFFGIGITEAEKEATELRISNLRRFCTNGQILNELGGEVRAEIFLSDIHFLMKCQSKGQSGSLLNSGYANIYYVRDVLQVLRVVDVRWFGSGWGIDARPTEEHKGWVSGYRLFSPM